MCSELRLIDLSLQGQQESTRVPSLSAPGLAGLFTQGAKKSACRGHHVASKAVAAAGAGWLLFTVWRAMLL